MILLSSKHGKETVWVWQSNLEAIFSFELFDLLEIIQFVEEIRIAMRYDEEWKDSSYLKWVSIRRKGCEGFVLALITKIPQQLWIK